LAVHNSSFSAGEVRLWSKSSHNCKLGQEDLTGLLFLQPAAGGPEEVGLLRTTFAMLTAGLLALVALPRTTFFTIHCDRRKQITQNSEK
jgi:hypothetical protein